MTWLVVSLEHNGQAIVLSALEESESNPGNCTSSGLLQNLTQLGLPSLQELEDHNQQYQGALVSLGA